MTIFKLRCRCRGRVFFRGFCCSSPVKPLSLWRGGFSMIIEIKWDIFVSLLWRTFVVGKRMLQFWAAHNYQCDKRNALTVPLSVRLQCGHRRTFVGSYFWQVLSWMPGLSNSKVLQTFWPCCTSRAYQKSHSYSALHLMIDKCWDVATLASPTSPKWANHFPKILYPMRLYRFMSCNCWGEGLLTFGSLTRIIDLSISKIKSLDFIVYLLLYCYLFFHPTQCFKGWFLFIISYKISRRLLWINKSLAAVCLSGIVSIHFLGTPKLILSHTCCNSSHTHNWFYNRNMILWEGQLIIVQTDSHSCR